MNHRLLSVVVFLATAVLSQPLKAADVWIDLDYATEDYVRTSMALYVRDEHNDVMYTFPIAGPQFFASCLRKSNVVGTIQTIEHHASWRPTLATKKAVFKEKGYWLENEYGPNDPKNALAGLRINILWPSGCVHQATHVHGTYDTEYVLRGARVSRSCIRMLPEDWKQLATLVQVGDKVTMSSHAPPPANEVALK